MLELTQVTLSLLVTQNNHRFSLNFLQLQLRSNYSIRCSQANNTEFRVINKVGDALTVVNRDGNPTTESAGASVTVTEDRKRLITIPDVVETAHLRTPIR
nr:MAG: hypothetical protein CM15mV30_1520 [uncultured marine virus]